MSDWEDVADALLEGPEWEASKLGGDFWSYIHDLMLVEAGELERVEPTEEERVRSIESRLAMIEDELWGDEDDA